MSSSSLWATSCRPGACLRARVCRCAVPAADARRAIPRARARRHHASSNARKLLPVSEHADAVVVVVGCGPVGICAITSASTWVKPGNLYAVDRCIPSSFLARADCSPHH